MADQVKFCRGSSTQINDHRGWEVKGEEGPLILYDIFILVHLKTNLLRGENGDTMKDTACEYHRWTSVHVPDEFDIEECRQLF